MKLSRTWFGLEPGAKHFRGTFELPMIGIPAPERHGRCGTRVGAHFGHHVLGPGALRMSRSRPSQDGSQKQAWELGMTQTAHRHFSAHLCRQNTRKAAPTPGADLLLHSLQRLAQRGCRAVFVGLLSQGHGFAQCLNCLGSLAGLLVSLRQLRKAAPVPPSAIADGILERANGAGKIAARLQNYSEIESILSRCWFR